MSENRRQIVAGSDLCLTNGRFPKLSSKSTLDCVFQSPTVDRVTEIRETTTSVTANKICARVVLNQSSQFPKASCKCLIKTEKILLRQNILSNTAYLLRPCAATLCREHSRSHQVIDISNASSDVVIVMANSQSNQTLVINS